MDKLTTDELAFWEHAAMVAMGKTIPFASWHDVDDYVPKNVALDSAAYADALLAERRKRTAAQDAPASQVEVAGVSETGLSARETIGVHVSTDELVQIFERAYHSYNGNQLASVAAGIRAIRAELARTPSQREPQPRPTPSELAKRVAEHVEKLDRTGLALDWEEVCQVVIAELAKMPVALPKLANGPAQDYNGASTYHVWLDIPFDKSTIQYGMTFAAAKRMVDAINCRGVGPILAAKDARIAELEAFRAIVAAATPFKENDNVAQHARDIVANIEGRTYRKALYEKTIPELRARITELEARAPANECSNAERAQYEATIELQKTRIAELIQQRDEAQGVSSVRAIHADALKRELSECEKERRECLDKLSDSSLVPPGLTLVQAIDELLRQYNVGMARDEERKKRIANLERQNEGVLGMASAVMSNVGHKFTPPVNVPFGPHEDRVAWLVQTVGEQRAKITELEKRLAEQSTPVDVNGKTPGLVFAAEFLIGGVDAVRKLGQDTLTSMERGAQAVLRAFGTQLVREALERVRERIGQLNGCGNRIPYDYEHGPFADYVCEAETFNIIDAEIASLGQPERTTDGHAPNPTEAPTNSANT